LIDEKGNPWQPLPCPAGSTLHVVDSTANKPHPQYGKLCYSTGLLSFEFLVQPGVYAIRLHFIEQNTNVRIGSRLFDISINDDFIKKPFDIYKTCGFKNECQIGSVVTDANGKLVIKLQWTKYNAVISGIEISPLLENVVMGCAFPEVCREILEKEPE